MHRAACISSGWDQTRSLLRRRLDARAIVEKPQNVREIANGALPLIWYRACDVLGP